MRDRPALWAVLLGAAALLVAWSNDNLGDYVSTPAPDNPAPGIAALADGELSEFARVQPVMGLTSLLLRTPAVALAGDDDLFAYRLGVAFCLLVVAALAWWVQLEMAARGSRPLARALVCALIVASPATLDALKLGHPEEPLGAALCVAAVLLATRERAALAGVALGLAIGTKPSFALAAVPVLLAAHPAGRRPLVLVTLAVAAVAVLPGPLSDTDRYREASRKLGSETQVRAWGVWYPAAEDSLLDVRYGPGDVQTITRHYLPLGLERSQVLVGGGILIALLLVLLWRARAARLPEDALALLALGFLLRCMLDPFNIGYYHVSALMALTAWEGLRFRRLPLISLAASAAFLVSFVPSDMATSLTLQKGTLAGKWAIYMMWTAALAAYLILRIGDQDGAPERQTAAGHRERATQPG